MSRGYACAEFGLWNTMTTRFTIASVTKQFTAFAVMLLYDRGLLSPDADVNIELYCIGPNTFVRRDEEQSYTHKLLPEGSEKPAVWGYERISRDL